MTGVMVFVCSRRVASVDEGKGRAVCTGSILYINVLGVYTEATRGRCPEQMRVKGGCPGEGRSL